VIKGEGENAQCRKPEVGKAFFFFDRRHEGKSRQPTTNRGVICLKNKANKREDQKQKINLKVAVERWRL